MEERKIKVTNRSDSYVGYNIPDAPAGYERDFAPGETKEIDYEEIKKLYWTQGGRRIIENYFVITDEEVLEDLNIVPEPEYFYSREDIIELLLNGTQDQLEDALEFGPAGVLDLIKDLAVDLQLPDMRKRKAIERKTGLNISAAIDLQEPTEVVEEKKTRRAEPVKAPTEKKERKSTPVSTGSKYKILEK